PLAQGARRRAGQPCRMGGRGRELERRSTDAARDHAPARSALRRGGARTRALRRDSRLRRGVLADRRSAGALSHGSGARQCAAGTGAQGFFRHRSRDEGNPQLALERGEKVSLPSLLVLQGTKDDNVTPDMAEKFTAAYRAAGGRAVLETFAGEPHTFVTRDPTSAASLRALALIQRFVGHRGAAA